MFDEEWSTPDQWQHHHVLTWLGIVHVGLQMSPSVIECTCPNQSSLLMNQACGCTDINKCSSCR